jgi:peptidoglycan/LPS O-acetylase OafA/YrhL
MKHLKELDGIRGFAALMVMCFHFFQYNGFHGAPWKETIQKLSIFGQTGVNLFFVLSGFLITRILLSTKNETGFFQTFYIRRLLRIFPLYYLFLLLYYFVLPLLSHTPLVPWRQQWYFWVYLQNFAFTFGWSNNGPNHFWSLAVEEHFYFFWPVLVYFLSLKKLTAAACGLILLSFVIRLVLMNTGFNSGFYFTFTNLDGLAAGTLLAIKEKKNGLSSFSAKKFGLLLTLLFIPTIILWIFAGGKSLLFIQAFKFPLIAFVYYAVTGLVISTGHSKPVIKIFKNKGILYTGKISYGLYVYHPLIFMYYAVYGKTGYFLPDLVLCFAAAFLIASLSYFFFESKILYFKKYFEYGRNDGISSKKAVPAPALTNVEN